MDEKKGLPLVILGIVAVIAIVGLVLLFKTAMSGAFSVSSYGYGIAKTYSGSATERTGVIYGSNVKGVAATSDEGIPVQYAGYWQPSPDYPAQVKPTVTRSTSYQTAPCYPGQIAENPAHVRYWEGDTPCI